MTQFTFLQSPFLPIVVGFFGLGTGYLMGRAGPVWLPKGG